MLNTSCVVVIQIYSISFFFLFIFFGSRKRTKRRELKTILHKHKNQWNGMNKKCHLNSEWKRVNKVLFSYQFSNATTLSHTLYAVRYTIMWRHIKLLNEHFILTQCIRPSIVAFFLIENLRCKN